MLAASLPPTRWPLRSLGGREGKEESLLETPPHLPRHPYIISAAADSSKTEFILSHLADVFVPSSFSFRPVVAAEEGWKEESLHESPPSPSPPSPTSIAFSFSPPHQVASQPSQWEVWKKKKKKKKKTLCVIPFPLPPSPSDSITKPLEPLKDDSWTDTRSLKPSRYSLYLQYLSMLFVFISALSYFNLISNHASSIHPSHQMAISAAWWEGWKEDLLEAPPFLALTPTTSSFHLSHLATSDACWDGWSDFLPTIPPVVEYSSTAGGIPPPLVALPSTSGGVPSYNRRGYNFFLKVLLLTLLMSPPTLLLFFLQMCLTVPASSCPPLPLKTSSQRSSTGCSLTIIVRVTSPPPNTSGKQSL